MDPVIRDLVSAYSLAPHPEGGFYKESYRSADSFTPAGFAGARSFSTAIYFLLPQGTRSRLHRIRADEVWHFYLGGPLSVVEITPEGNTLKTVLGPDLKGGQKLQHVVPAGHWFGSYPEPNSQFSFVGCTVAPGFDFADFELGKRSDLLALFPDAAPEILRLTDP
ncbi:MAG: cupin domain-containing protein [Elusimicrobia bacterium]|nr:cupin domain-containing protein [Elusimicrobiota bacterium]